MTWRKEMNARKPAEKRKRTLRQWGFLSIHVVLLFALWAAIVAVNINITHRSPIGSRPKPHTSHPASPYR